MAKQYRHNASLDVREIEGQVFLIDEEGGKIHHLNETASAIWRLLEVPATRKEIVAEFRFLFPDEKPKRLKRAIKALLADLSDLDVLRKTKVSTAG